VSPTEREITESARVLAATHLEDGVLGKSTRLVPEPGAEGGLRIFGVRADSVLGRLGFENGDVVTSFAPGRDGGAASALESLAGMKTAKEATIGIRRRGQALALHYRVVP
jgi:general secretion pathway protein C